MIVKNLTKRTTLATQVTKADSFTSRSKGLLGRDGLSMQEGLIITRCQQIHMFFMKFVIDALFVDKNNVVVGIVSSIAPNRLSRIYWRASFVVELFPGAIGKSQTEVGDTIEILP